MWIFSARLQVRTVNYRIYWSYTGSIKRQGTLVDLVLDILYLMEESGVIPPLVVLNQVLQSGGDSGGMGPGSTWKPFQIDETEYEELVQSLLYLDVEDARKSHPYIRFERVIVDSDLNQCTDHLDWLTKSHAKYSKNA
jgi:hypothetical protein